jgi:hypothetical protein
MPPSITKEKAADAATAASDQKVVGLGADMIAFPFIDRIVRGTLAAAELDFLCKRLWRRVPKPVNRLATDPAIF